ncbi:Stm1-domain-containing protein [Sordaria brevicollis]|uniref:Stm1-domain-containing protein n=1 Tax=Sordaria brevicollis TaxID=83679 RepID=A0AAE0P205_SORBR|nr:Stm1-domain-containing protein [Sordaria brevicollis]
MSVASKNLFDLLGNDVEDNSAPAAPAKIVEKTSTHTAKRNTDGLAPSTKAPAQGSGRRSNVTGNEAAFRDRAAGSDRNRGKPTEEGAARGPRGGANARVRGGRGGRHPRTSDDRHSKSIPTGSEKQAAQSWGATEGQAELKDEQAAAEAAAEEEEEKHVSYSEYLAQLAEKKAALEAEAALKVRKANEGVVEDKKWANAKPLQKDESEEFIAGSAGKKQRERERKVKQVLEIDQRFVEPERPARGGARGGARGPRGDAPRGRGGPRGGARGGARGPAPRAENKSAPIKINDEKDFPSLGN